MTESLASVFDKNIKNMENMLTNIVSKTSAPVNQAKSSENDVSKNIVDNTVATFTAIETCELRKRKLLSEISETEDENDKIKKKQYIDICDKRIQSLYDSMK